MWLRKSDNRMSRQDYLEGRRSIALSATLACAIGDRIRHFYLQIAYLVHDPAFLQSQRAWASTHPEATFCLLTEEAIAVTEGRFADAHRLIDQITAILRRQGLNDLTNSLTKALGINLIDAGDRSAGIRLFRSIPVDPEEGFELVGLVEAGDLDAAHTDLNAMLARYPRGTLWTLYYGPRIQAAIAIARHKPVDAIAILEPTRPLDGRDFDIPSFRGNTYLAAGQPALAEKEFRNILAHPEIDPTSADYPLSWLGLGRALAAEGKRSAAIDSYQHYFSLWAHADPDATFLKQARQELANIER